MLSKKLMMAPSGIDYPTGENGLNTIQDFVDGTMGDIRRAAISEDGKHVYAIATDLDHVAVINVEDPANMSLVSIYTSAALDGASGIETYGDYIFVIVGAPSYHMVSINVANPSNLVQVDISSSSSQTFYNDSHTVIKDKIIYTANLTNYVSAIDVSNPSNLDILDSFDIIAGDRLMGICISDSNNLYIGSEANDRIITVNAQDPANLVYDTYHNSTMYDHIDNLVYSEGLVYSQRYRYTAISGTPDYPGGAYTYLQGLTEEHSGQNTVTFNLLGSTAFVISNARRYAYDVSDPTVMVGGYVDKSMNYISYCNVVRDSIMFVLGLNSITSIDIS